MNEQIEKWSHKPSHVKLENLNKSYRQLWLTFYRNASICANNLKLLETSFRNSKFSNFSKQLWIFVESKNPNPAKPQVRIVEAFGQSVFSTSVSISFFFKKNKTWNSEHEGMHEVGFEENIHKIIQSKITIFQFSIIFFRREQILWWKNQSPKNAHLKGCLQHPSLHRSPSFAAHFLEVRLKSRGFSTEKMVSWIWYDRTKRVYRPYTHRVLYV